MIQTLGVVECVELATAARLSSFKGQILRARERSRCHHQAEAQVTGHVGGRFVTAWPGSPKLGKMPLSTPRCNGCSDTSSPGCTVRQSCWWVTQLRAGRARLVVQLVWSVVLLYCIQFQHELCACHQAVRVEISRLQAEVTQQLRCHGLLPRICSLRKSFQTRCIQEVTDRRLDVCRAVALLNLVLRDHLACMPDVKASPRASCGSLQVGTSKGMRSGYQEVHQIDLSA